MNNYADFKVRDSRVPDSGVHAMPRLFVDRERELRLLEEAYSSNRPELVVVYGRRRIGKTFLVRLFMRRHGGVYLVVNYSERSLILRDLSRQVSEAIGSQVSFEWFRDLLHFTLKLAGKRPLLVIDEFQRMAGTGLLSELQSFWDLKANEYNPVIVLVGSGVGVVERLALSYNSPIYGRTTRILRVEGFNYREARVFMKNWTPEDRVRGYTAFGGTPHYLSMIDSSLTLEENLLKLVLEPGAPLHEEPLALIRAETREPDRYIAILEALARGCTRPVEIGNYVGIPRDVVHRYLRVLEEGLGIVKRVYPLGMEGKPGYAQYTISDNFFLFWFSEVYPRRHLLQLDPKALLRKVVEGLERHTAQAWEQVALEHMHLLRRQGRIGFTRIGKWWWKGVEIDLVAVDEEENTVILVECKWGKATRRTLQNLVAKARAFPWRKRGRREVYVIYAREAEGLEEREGELYVYTLDQVDQDFEKNSPMVVEV